MSIDREQSDGRTRFGVSDKSSYTLAMSTVSIRDLSRNASAVIAEAEEDLAAGRTVSHDDVFAHLGD